MVWEHRLSLLRYLLHNTLVVSCRINNTIVPLASGIIVTYQCLINSVTVLGCLLLETTNTSSRF